MTPKLNEDEISTYEELTSASRVASWNGTKFADRKADKKY
jgi:hypothetical protein